MNGTLGSIWEALQNGALMRAQAEQGFPEASKDFLQGAAGLVVPTTPEDAGLMLALGPAGKVPSALRQVGAALAATGYAPDAAAGSGALMSLYSKLNPEIGAALTEAEKFGKTFDGSSADGQGDAARHAYAAARVSALRSPEYAKRMGALYEMLSLGSDRRATAMDEFNNEIGTRLADYPQEVQQEMIRRLMTGGVEGIPQLKWSRTPYEGAY